MHKILIIIISVFMLLVVGCSQGVNTASNPSITDYNDYAQGGCYVSPSESNDLNTNTNGVDF